MRHPPRAKTARTATEEAVAPARVNQRNPTNPDCILAWVQNPALYLRSYFNCLYQKIKLVLDDLAIKTQTVIIFIK
jgi:hypothetical protein